MIRRLTQMSVFLAATVLVPVAAFAQEHGVEEKVEAVPTLKQGLYSAVTTLVVFGLVFAVLSLKVWPVITKALDERAGKIKDEIDAAEMARKQAKDALEQYQQSLAQARAEAQKMLEQTKAQQLALAADLKAKADVDLAQMREKATREIEQAKRAAINEVYAQASTLATSMAGKILRREVRASDHSQLVEDSLRQLQTTHG